MPIYAGTPFDDRLTGSAGSDSISGYAGNDTIDDGGGGPDELVGDTGNDIYIVSDARNTIVENVGEGTDTVRTALARYILAANVENLTFTGSSEFTGQGNAGDNTIVGGSGDDYLIGLEGRDYLIGAAGNDTLDGGTGVANQLQGGTGNDIYIVGAVGDSVVELAGEGTDTVRTALANFTLPSNVENLFFTGAGSFNGTGNAENNVILGGAASDSLFGGDGYDYLNGNAGADTLDGGTGIANQLQGGTGDDTYIVGVAGDSIVEFANEGIDTVRTAVASFTLGSNVENLVYAGTATFRGLGNVLDNVIVGGVGNDVLAGYGGADTLIGGAGDDSLEGGTGLANTMIGGTGDDRYYVDAVGDSVVENAGEGFDRIQTTLASYNLPDNVELLVYAGNGNFTGRGSTTVSTIVGGIGDDTLYAGAIGDRLIGGAGNDSLFGGGGVTLIGGVGNDIYYRVSSATIIDERPGEGIDTVLCSVDPGSYTLPANVENFGWLSQFGAATRVTGNALDNIIQAGSGTPNSGESTLFGLDGNDTLSGGEIGNSFTGGNGNDILIGTTERGADRFIYEGGETGIDTVRNFQTGLDTFSLQRSYFTPTATVDFVQGAGAVATSTNSTFIYNAATGAILYDDDGIGAGAPIYLANIAPGLTLAATDFNFY